MISYETYKYLHLVFILTFFSSLGFAASSFDFILGKKGKFLLGLVSFLIMVAGMGLIARLGFKHTEPFPLWIYLKFGAWLLINLFFVLLFKLKNRNMKFLTAILFIVTGWAAIWVALNKPY